MRNVFICCFGSRFRTSRGKVKCMNHDDLTHNIIFHIFRIEHVSNYTFALDMFRYLSNVSQFVSILFEK